MKPLSVFLLELAQKFEEGQGGPVTLTGDEAKFYAHELRNLAWIAMNEEAEKAKCTPTKRTRS